MAETSNQTAGSVPAPEKATPELREQIYHHVLGGKTILIGRGTSRLHTKWLPTEDGEGDPTIDEASGTKLRRISLLLTCREIYSEAINILYSGNTLQLDDGVLPAFELPAELRSVFVPQRFDAIRSLDVRVRFWHFRDWQLYNRKWELQNSDGYRGPLPDTVWDVIATMKGLRRLLVRFGGVEVGGPAAQPDRRFSWFTTEESALQPLMKIDWIPNFRVEVSWPENHDSKKLFENAPFQLAWGCEIPDDAW
ncbi:hypothetical protein N7510_006345 [Penicillium lagena]|uniref:uncharacterized protein n=1 Tax=Penicillium lagena TaxID=94218 RepID=UPI00253F6F43|nr:uncharacterized protein N7510_006345 [Penicillium lagena]KAJ5613151.1 hypothetical protein N7510_006345 [Penicillium lagena]